MAKRYPKIDHYFICDDMRQEIGNKISLLGIYPGNVISMPIPATIPKLCFHLVLSNIRSGDNLTIRLIDPNDKEIAKFDRIEVPSKKQFKQAVFDLGFLNIRVKKEGTYQLIIILNKEEKAKQEINIEIKKAK